MNNLSTVTDNADLIHFDDAKVQLIKRMIAPDATEDELALFLHQCQRTGLDPLARQIYFQKYSTRQGPRMSIITGIDGYRLVADRTGKYAGSCDPVFGDPITAHDDANLTVPKTATVTVQKLVAGQARDFTATAHWREYYPGGKKGHMWRKMPCVMLAKVAEAAALRKAFPADLSGVYTADEMQQAEWSEPVVIEGELETTQRWVSGPDNTDAILEEEEPTPSTNGQPGLPIEPTKPPTPEQNTDIDADAVILDSPDLTLFALNVVEHVDEYERVEHVVGALLNKYPKWSGTFEMDERPAYLRWLRERKQQEAT